MNLNSRQKQILDKLLRKYESSKTYKGENAVRQSFSISPSDVYPNYDNDFEDPNSIEDFEKELNVLKTENLIEIEIKDRRVIKIKAETSDDIWFKIRSFLGVKEKKVLQQEELDFYKNFLYFSL